MGRRGYKVIDLKDEEVPILFTNRAIGNAEKIMGKGILGVLAGFQDGGSGVHEVATLLQAGAENARKVEKLRAGRFTQNDAYRVLDEIGFTAVASIVFEAVGEVLSKDADDDDDVEDEKN